MAKGFKSGGRQKGSTNKVLAPVRTAIANLINGYYDSDDFRADIAALAPYERVNAIERLTAYVMPKYQSVQLDIKSDERITIEERLISLSLTDHVKEKDEK